MQRELIRWFEPSKHLHVVAMHVPVENTSGAGIAGHRARAMDGVLARYLSKCSAALPGQPLSDGKRSSLNASACLNQT
ncbi:hypothetical protein [Roseomonas marmotae]|uniref:Uncharacterized protein n=1 Tax=Roseomonas marmotae TaxID=2768161 RepID=A0ABS3KIH5_9PROT|nr:hypothetical protein [Roseomonas marmotae]MBO1077273.1 hypothetical protein [Roseomonas marmotae]QTI81061.1 hypothetical protein IAI58_16920 [Roseomonas marmotae]